MTCCLCGLWLVSFLLIPDYFGVSFFFFFKQKTAYEMRISDWSSDVCSSDLNRPCANAPLSTKAGAAALLGASVRGRIGAAPTLASIGNGWQIGRASCRERVCQYV